MRKLIDRKRFILIFLLVISFLGCSNLKKDKTAQYFLLKGINLSQQGDFEKALNSYNEAYIRNPKDIILLKELGFIYYKFDQHDKAEKYWLEGLDVSAKDDQIIKNLATMYYKNGRYEDANKIIELSINPNNEYYKKIKGLILYEQGDIINSYNILSTINKSNFDELTYIKYLDIIKNSKTPEEYYEALKDGEELFKNSKEYTLIYSKELAQKLNMPKEAEEVLLRYLLNNGNDKDIILRLSWVYLQAGNKEKAKDSLLLLPKSIK